MPDRSTLRFQGVGFNRDALILGEIDWRVEPGQNWVILGANGSGKSTLLGLAAAHLHPSTGSVSVLGETLGRTDVRKLRRRIAFSGGSLMREFDPRSSILDVVATGATAALVPWWERPSAKQALRAARLIEDLGIAAIANSTFGVVSEGERQKAMLARALMTSAELVLLDEPFAGLDVGARERLLERLTSFVATGAAPLVMVTHHVEEIPPGVTHAMLMRQGRVIASGPVNEVLTSASISTAFDFPLTVEKNANRWSCRSSNS